jgi:R-phycocyanin alpha-cysteine-84 phycourobilin lyase/isomerase
MLTTTVNEPILSIETAITALNSDDNQTRYYAAWWLGKHQAQSACDALSEALKDEQYRTEAGGYPLRRQAARALAQLKNPQAVPALLAALNTDDLRLKEAVIQALANIGDRQAIPFLIDLIKSEEQQPLEPLIEALGSLGVWEVKSLIKPFLENPSERVQCAASRYLFLCTEEPQYIERIVRNLNHENMYLRWAAAFDLGAIGHLQAANAILSAQIGNSLKMLNLKNILITLLSSENDHNSEEKKRFLLTVIDDLLLDKILVADQVSYLQRDLNDLELINQLQKAVLPLEIIPLIQELTNRKITDLIPILLQMLAHHHPAISTVAVEGLVKLAPDSVLPLIAHFQSCKDHGIQAYIVQALAQIGEIKSLDLLLQVIGTEVANHCQGSVRRVAAIGLGNIASKTTDNDIINICLNKLTWTLLNVEDWALRYAAVVSLETLGGNLSKNILQKALTTEADQVVKLRIEVAQNR